MKRGLVFFTFFLVVLIATSSTITRSAQAAPTSTFTVNSTADVSDADPGNGVCHTSVSNNSCTLRAAIQEANAHPDADTIKIPSGFYQLTQIAQGGFVTTGLIITTPITILGAGANNTIIDGNATVLHARVFNITGTVTISGVTIQHGHSYNTAGGIYNTGQLIIINSAIISNTANGLNDWGGGIYNAGPMTLTNSLIRGNTTGNHNAYGGGMYNQGPLLVIDSTFSDNSTFAGTSSPGEGGGLFSIGYTTTIKTSTFSGNSAALGGGIYHGGYALYLINSTISGNNSDGGGGGIYNASGTIDLFNVTVVGNLANADNSGTAIGGGVDNNSGTFNFRNSIIALNGKVVVPGPIYVYSDCAGTITTQGYNIMKDTSDCIVAPVTIADPLLGPLQDNGGRTQTYALLSNSPAINAGESPYCTDALGAPITTDQRGVTRPINSCDIGAYEYRWTMYLPLVKK